VVQPAHDRYGVLWAERFKSVLLEGGEAVAAVAAYIELNPVRAGLCADPKDYRYCGLRRSSCQGLFCCPSRYRRLRLLISCKKSLKSESMGVTGDSGETPEEDISQ
jgi:hypothetical protein